MDTRELLIDGIEQMNDWLDGAIKDLDDGEVNYLPPGKTVSIGFNTWHVLRTQDNITNFVLQDRKPPIWIAEGFADRMGLPKVDQGTGMGLEEARSLSFNLADLREYGQRVNQSTINFLKSADMESLNAIQMIKPLGEMPKVKVVRQVIMTHGFMHLGEVNAIKGQLGLGFFL
ncbi:MAG TPA: DinB family protein [Tepidiformaceae bacterium]|nr:DinB family protein [Tepidiformaceae bacterium]